MHFDKSNLLLLMLLFFSLSCKITEEDFIKSGNRETVVSSPIQLFVSDSFGVEIGDSINMIGSLDNNYFCHHPNGSLLLLDRREKCLRVIPEDGAPYRVLRIGEAPGELLGPQGLCALSDGRILISDMYKRDVMTYDEENNFFGSYYVSSEKPPSQIYAVDSSSIVGTMFDNMLIEGEMQLCYSINRYDSSIEPSVNYYLLNFDRTGWDESIKIMDVLDFHADRFGNVYAVEDFTRYQIDVFFEDGSLRNQIDRPVEQLPKSDEQIEAEIIEYAEFASTDQYQTGEGYEPMPFNQLISLAGVDVHGNLWVRRYDYATGYNFDIWNENGELVNTAFLETNNTALEMDFLVDEFGIVAAVVDSDDYPRVYFIETDSTSISD